MIRLLNIDTQELQEYSDKEIPAYVIASHRWLDGEASYQDLKDRANSNSPGLRKVREFCQYLQGLPGCIGFRWLWIDTVCIDKTNSVELSEAIVSMFQWYKRAYFCVVYLHDVSTGRFTQFPDQVKHALHDSDWFTRGWTLQELLAPDVVIFMDRDWHTIGHKASHKRVRLPQGFPCGPPLNHHLASITKISEDILWNYLKSSDLSYRKRMTWLENRETSRKEDHAYCMLGILNVKIVPMYGEGRLSAWQRLEEEARKCQILPEKEKTQSDVSYYKPNGRPFSRSVEALPRLWSSQVLETNATVPGHGTGAQTADSKPHLWSQREDNQPSEEERKTMIMQLHKAQDASSKALLDSQNLRNQLSEMTKKLDGSHQERERLLLRLDDEQWKRREAQADLERLRLLLSEERSQGEQFKQEAVAGLRMCHQLQESLERVHAAAREDSHQRKVVETQLSDVKQQLSELRLINGRLEAHSANSEQPSKALNDSQDPDSIVDKQRYEAERQLREALEEELKRIRPTPDSQKAPIRFLDAVGRKFAYPFHLCKTWSGMEELIKQSFSHVELIGDLVHQGHYDLTGPDDNIILPQVWETVIQPDWQIKMHLWPVEDEKPPPAVKDLFPFEWPPPPGYGDPFACMNCMSTPPQRSSRGRTKKERSIK